MKTLRNLKLLTLLVFIITIKSLYAQNNDSILVAKYIKQAEVFLKQKDCEKVREYSLKALEINPHIGKAYIIIGSAYIYSVETCSENAITSGMIFCLAVDMFQKAKEVDESVSKRADQMIEAYSQYFFDQGVDGFVCNTKEGEKYKIGCWINEETTVRFFKKKEE